VYHNFTIFRFSKYEWHHHARCPLCDQLPEMMHHLLLECPFSQQIWYKILAWLRMTCRPPCGNDASLFDWWITARQQMLKPLHKGLASATLLTPWMLWKHRNSCIFEQARPSASALIGQIKNEAALWARAGATGLRDVLPMTWDVH
jgi:hypothetical protein